jgi:hypothetical protein
MSALTQPLTHRIAEFACLAPSVHNTQPWRWRIRNDHLVELWADRDRQLRVADPDGRNLAISCGAALHHFIVASRALGATSTVDLTPVGGEPGLLATIRLSPGRTASDAAESLEVLTRRRTDRRRFTSWPVPESRLAHLTRAAAGWGAFAIPILDVGARFHTELLLSRASTAQQSDPRLAEEQRAWTERSSVDGVPSSNAAPPSRARSADRPNRFASQPPTDTTDAQVESSDGLVAVCTAMDDQRSWLEAGQVLSALWLQATADGLSVVPLSQVIEVAETRAALYHDVFTGLAHPQILLRIGWQEISRASLDPSPRRPMSDVLLH